MSQQPRVLIELGEELRRAAARELGAATQRELETATVRRGRGRRLGTGPFVAGLALASAMAVALVAVLTIGHRHPAPGPAGPGHGAAASRGEILDRGGRVLVGSRRATDIEIDPARLPIALTVARAARLTHPPAADQRVYDAVAHVLGISTRPRTCWVSGRTHRLAPIACQVAETVVHRPVGNVTVGREVSGRVRALTHRLPGVEQVTVRVTSYPHGDLAAQVLGEVGPITAAELRDPRFHGLPADALVGQTGLESYYDRYLEGRAGRPGDTLQTSLDLGLEQSAQSAMAAAVAHRGSARAGAFVAMNPENGQVYAIGSLPSYNANLFTRPITSSAYRALTTRAADAPLMDRAASGLYPVGAPFEPITALAALESGRWPVGATYNDAGQFCLDGRLCYHNQGRAAYGALNLVAALRVSDSIFFADLGRLMNANPASDPQGGELQQWARLLGLGRSTGIDLAYESSGSIPDPRDLHSRWNVADNVDLALGQGGLQATPLQLAVAYAAIANGGSVVRPHLATAIESPNGGQVITRIDPPPVRHLALDPADLRAVRQGLRASASAPGGSAAPAVAALGKPAYGMVGATSTGRGMGPAWFAGYVPASATSRPIVVVVTLENDGSAASAGLVARQILQGWYRGAASR